MKVKAYSRIVADTFFCNSKSTSLLCSTRLMYFPLLIPFTDMTSKAKSPWVMLGDTDKHLGQLVSSNVPFPANDLQLVTLGDRGQRLDLVGDLL